MMCGALHRLVVPVNEQGTWAFMTYNVFFRLCNTSMEVSYDIGAHKEIQKAEFVMPELLLK